MITNWKIELEKMLGDEELLKINIAGDMYYPEMLNDAFKRLEREFDDGFGGNEGEPFWAWTKTKVYFCTVYDGAEWIDSIPRNPQFGEPTHIGGQ